MSTGTPSAVDLTALSQEDLENALKVKKEQDRKKKEQDRQEYETSRDSTVKSAIEQALSVNKVIQDFASNIHVLFEELYEKKKQYVGINSKSKGGTQFVTIDQQMKIVRRLRSNPTWDERAEEAVSLINDFLNDKLKRTKAYKIIRALIERNKVGQLSYSMVMKLIDLREDYDDERWVRGIELLEESHMRTYSGYRYEFFVRDDKNEWKRIELGY